MMDLIQSRREQESGCVISITLRLTEKEIWMDRDGESDDGDGEIIRNVKGRADVANEQR